MTVTNHLHHPDYLSACESGDLETVSKILLDHESLQGQVSTAALEKGLSNAVWGRHHAVADLLLSQCVKVN